MAQNSVNMNGVNTFNGYVELPIDSYNNLLKGYIGNCMLLEHSYNGDLNIIFDNRKIYEAAMNMLSRQVAVDPGDYDVKDFKDFNVYSATIAKKKPDVVQSTDDKIRDIMKCISGEEIINVVKKLTEEAKHPMNNGGADDAK